LQLDLPPRAEQVLRSDGDDEVFFAVRSPQGRLIAGDADLPAAPGPRAAATQHARRAGAGRGAGGRQAGHGHGGQNGAQAPQARQAIVRALVLLETLFALALVGLIWFSVSSGLRPLNRVRAVLAARGATTCRRCRPPGCRMKLEPVAQAFNGLLDRIDGGARAQQDFLANVAHQLRTPLAGLHAAARMAGAAPPATRKPPIRWP
jgi:two-component system sensor histidine kinase TctE